MKIKASRNVVDYVTSIAQDRLMREEVESKLLGLLDYYGLWSVMIDLTAHHFEGREWCPDRDAFIDPKGSPGKITTGLRDLLLMMEMHHAQAEGRGVEKTANDLAEEWKKMGLWSDSGKTLRRHYLRLCRNGPTMSMARTASALFSLRKPGN